jgi:hypothetical protein
MARVLRMGMRLVRLVTVDSMRVCEHDVFNYGTVLLLLDYCCTLSRLSALRL